MRHLRSQRFMRVLGTGCLAAMLLASTLLPATSAAAAPSQTFKVKPCGVKNSVHPASGYC